MNRKVVGKPGQNIVRLQVQVIPNAKRAGVAGMHGDALKIRLQAQPIEGRANEALVKFVAEALKLPKGEVSVSHGQTSRRKLLEIIVAPSMTAEDVTRALLTLVTPD